jgi:asparagine synthase (glutamine-hydrolysing)
MTEDEKARAAAFARGAVELPADRVAGIMRPGLDAVQQVSYAEAEGYLRDTLLRDADAMGMAHGLEVRPVLLDHELAGYVFALPARHKLSRGRTKPLLTDALAGVLPEEIVHRRKMGFELPLNAWLGTVLRERARALLDGRAAREIFAPAYRSAQRAELDALAAGVPRPPRLWAQVVLLACMERHGLTADGG